MKLARPSPIAALETVLITAAALGIGWLLDRHDPFFLRHPFSWLVLVPLLVGLRHGFALGCASALALDAALVFSWRARAFGVERLPGETFVGLLAIAMLTGQLSDVWRREVRRLDVALDALRTQSSELSRSHLLLELSHDRLAQESVGTSTLRDALVAIDRVAEQSGGAPWPVLGASMMDVFAQYCQVEVASLHVVDARGKVEAAPVAVLGRPEAIDPSDPMIARALESVELTYLPTATSATDVARASKLLAAVPLVDTGGKLHAVLAAHAIPFMAFHRDNLEALASLAGHFADVVAAGGADRGRERTRREELEQRVARALRDLEAFAIPSIVSLLTIAPGSVVSGMVEVILAATLDPADTPLVTRTTRGDYVVYVLSPASDEAAARARGARIEALVQGELGLSLGRAGASYAFHALAPRDTVYGVMRMLAQKAHVDASTLEDTVVG